MKYVIPFAWYVMYKRYKIAHKAVGDIRCDACEELIRVGDIYFTAYNNKEHYRYHFCYFCYDTLPHEVFDF